MISFEEAKNLDRNENAFAAVCGEIETLLGLVKEHPQLTELFEYPYRKNESNFINYQHREKTVERVLFRDRRHPVDTVILNDFNRKTGADIKNAELVYGPSADEYTRSHHALAIAAAGTIYFRNGAYRPETEEGRKLLAHELTHVAQYKEKEEYRNTGTEEKEREAEEAEKNEAYSPDKIIRRTVSGKEYSLAEPVWKKIDKQTVQKVQEKIELLKAGLSEEEYLELLMKYKKWDEDVWQN
ncbi:MAG: DUF4157 domain-containing protein [Treponema sp.]|nr:DUF4157 domain-containing protein [Treponema sp.]